MRIPYIVGRWVNGTRHYGRQRLFDYLLDTPDTATWIVGARRMGKTSLLRQLEMLTAPADSELVPLFWDMQGCESSQALSDELFLALEDASSRFSALGIAVTEWEGLDALLILRRLARILHSRGQRLLLLIDEAEVLIQIARNEAAWLARLRRSLQDPALKTMVASTKLLIQLNAVTADWPTSPFLFGFNMVNLWSLDPDSAVALVEQRQAPRHVHASAAILEEILLHTHRHPYLIQFLCQRLYSEDSHGQGFLRAPADEDLDPDQLLAGFFLIDFQQMTRLERRLLLAVGQHTLTTEAELLADLADADPQRIRTYLWGMEKLGHLRRIYDQLAIGNEYLRRWLLANRSRLEQMDEALVDEESFAQILQIGYTREPASYQVELERLEQQQRQLQETLALCQPDQRAAVASELNRLGQQLDQVRRDVERTRQRPPLAR